MVRERTEGNPLAAGLIAFAGGWLVASLLPASGVEQRLAQTVGEHGVEPVKQEATQVAQELKEDLRGPAEDAVSEVRDSITDAAGSVRDEGASAAREVKGQGRQAAQDVRQQAGDR
jgi:gas vesicle protein